MQQVVLIMLLPLLVSLFLLLSCYIVGDFIVVKFKLLPGISYSFDVSICCALGFGILANISIVLSLMNLLNAYVVWIICGLVLAFGYKKVVKLLSKTLGSINSLRSIPFEEKVVLSIAAVFFLFYLVGAFLPPYLNDEIAYHLPHALKIADGKLLSLSGYGVWGGNMPVLVETFYAFLYRMHGFTLMHLVHYQMLLVLLLAVYSVVKKEFSNLAGLISVVLIFAFHPLASHATSAYIDAGTLMFESIGVLLFFLWVKYKNKNLLILSGAMYGLALATKYTPFYSLAIIAILFLYYNYRYISEKKDFFLNLVYFAGPAVLLGGFWYFKNLFLLGNPIYPFIFGHHGFTDQALASVLYDVRYLTGLPIVKPTLINYLLFPYKLFWSPYYFTLLLSLIVFPFGLVLKNNSKFLRSLMLFAFCFITVWFFVISNNIHYGLIGPIFLLIVCAITISVWVDRLKYLFRYKLLKVLSILILVIPIVFVMTHRGNNIIKMKNNEIMYTFGLISESEFYSRNGLGELFAISNYINDNFKDTNIMNNWDSFSMFLKSGNSYLTLVDFDFSTASVSWSDLCNYLESKNIKMLSINNDYRARVLGDEWAVNKGGGVIFEKYKLLEDIFVLNSQLIYAKYSGQLYLANSCVK